MSDSNNEKVENIPVAKTINVNVYPVSETANYNFNEINGFNEVESNQLKAEIYNRCRIVKFLTIIDIIFLVINLAVSIANKNSLWIAFFLLPLCFSGYYGADNFKKYFLSAYNFYLLLMCIFYFTITFYYNSFILLLIFFIEVYFLIYCTKLFYMMNDANENMLISLREGWKPEALVIYYY